MSNKVIQVTLSTLLTTWIGIPVGWGLGLVLGISRSGTEGMIVMALGGIGLAFILGVLTPVVAFWLITQTVLEPAHAGGVTLLYGLTFMITAVVLCLTAGVVTKYLTFLQIELLYWVFFAGVLSIPAITAAFFARKYYPPTPALVEREYTR